MEYQLGRDLKDHLKEMRSYEALHEHQATWRALPPHPMSQSQPLSLSLSSITLKPCKWRQLPTVGADPRTAQLCAHHNRQHHPPEPHHFHGAYFGGTRAFSVAPELGSFGQRGLGRSNSKDKRIPINGAVKCCDQAC